VIAVSSGEALAADLMHQADLDRVVVVGDARRDSLWWGAFHRQGDRAIPDGNWHTTAPADLPGALPPHVRLVSPQWPRLQQTLNPSLLSSLPWIRETLHPAAATIGRIAYHHHQAGIPSEPLTPLYLHPAVRPA
jgi:tRNA A37 threonylcarbamoyladenosine modification protein TsaB